MVHVVNTLLWAPKRFDNIPGIPLVDGGNPGELSTSTVIWVCWCWRRDDDFGAQVEEDGTGAPEVCCVSLNDFGLITGMVLLCQIPRPQGVCRLGEKVGLLVGNRTSFGTHAQTVHPVLRVIRRISSYGERSEKLFNAMSPLSSGHTYDHRCAQTQSQPSHQPEPLRKWLQIGPHG